MISTAFSMSPLGLDERAPAVVQPRLRAIAELLDLLHVDLRHDRLRLLAGAMRERVDDLRLGQRRDR